MMTPLEVMLTILISLCTNQYTHLNPEACYGHAKKCMVQKWYEKDFRDETEKEKVSRIFNRCTEDLQ